MVKRKTVFLIAGIGGLFLALAGAIILLWLKYIITIQMALLMMVALFGLYIGFGTLIAIYILVSKLD